MEESPFFFLFAGIIALCFCRNTAKEGSGSKIFCLNRRFFLPFTHSGKDLL